MILRKDISNFLKTLNNDVILVAATKYVDADTMKEMLNNGINNFGENRVDSFLRKHEILKHENIIWHFIGHLQRNKAKKIIAKIDYLHSLDSIELAKLINDNRVTPLNCFIEVSINNEENKNGVKVEHLEDFIKQLQPFSNINVVGFMMMSKIGSDEKSLDKQFVKLDILRNEIEIKFNMKIPYLSMGMSDDYLIALKHHATHIRLGRILYEK